MPSALVDGIPVDRLFAAAPDQQIPVRLPSIDEYAGPVIEPAARTPVLHNDLFELNWLAL
jgi:hypothetical protein